MTTARKRSLIVWLASLVTILVLSNVRGLLDRMDYEFPPLYILSFFAWVAFCFITLYWIAVAIRWTLRRLFWRVGRRLVLSYFLVGILPFFLFAIELFVMSYLTGGVLTRAALRSERQATLTRMDRWNLEYAVTKNTPPDRIPTLKIFEVVRDAPSQLPKWLTAGSFSGLVARGEEVFFVSSRIYSGGDGDRSIVLVLPVDDAWSKNVQERTGMIVANSISTEKSDVTVHAGAKKRKAGSNDPIVWSQNGKAHQLETDAPIDKFLEKNWRPGRIIWADVSAPLVDWNSGEPDETKHLFTLIANPIENLTSSLGGTTNYLKIVLTIAAAIAGLLLVVYLFAALFAAVLIFSISRAVNRIEKGTKAVEKGDFSYRIRMKPHNQLGEVAQSFDRMTESIGGLLQRVAEQERLQSEISIAASIQRNLLPKEGPNFRGVSFSAHFEPTASIGGDYYDVFNLDRTRLAVTIGDVSGHGLSTGLVMAMVKAAITTLVEEGADESSLFKRLNDLVLRSTEKRAFMTLGFTIFDLEKRTLRHTNAGHLYPYILRKDTDPLAVEAPSLPLGIRPNVEPVTIELPLREGDTVVYLSDGIVEAQNETGDPFGFDSLERILQRTSGQDPAAVQEEILRAVAAHSGGRSADDDRTVMIIRFDQLRDMRIPAEESSTLRPLREELAPVVGNE